MNYVEIFENILLFWMCGKYIEIILEIGGFDVDIFKCLSKGI